MSTQDSIVLITKRTKMRKEDNFGFILCFMAGFLLLLGLMSCGSKYNKYNNRKFYPYPITDVAWVHSRVQLIFPPDTKEKHQKYLTESATIQLDAYEIDNGVTRKCDVVYFDEAYLTMNNDGVEYWGFCHHPDGPIQIIMGRYLDSSALYHELCHYNQGWADTNHEDARWESLWNPRWLSVLHGIQADRKHLDLEYELPDSNKTE